MRQHAENLLTFIKPTPNHSEPEDNFSLAVQDQNFNNLVSSVFSKVNDTELEFKQVINMLSQSPEFTSDPQKLLILQNYIGEYSNYASLVSTLARKGVSTIETLIKSQ